ncbi:MAG: UDP-N-acetylmuramoyl-tripeptide--D-alanyl-D-alanine ligase, partial [Bacteroidota bacterium]
RQMEIPVIGITGSNGKTTTKELLYRVLATTYKVHVTLGNLNNHIGVPLTLLAMPLDTEVAIIEMGANHQGEIAALCEIAEPTHGLITNIGKAHLEGFGGIEGVKKGKSELYRFLAKNQGLAFVNLDEAHLRKLAASVHHVIEYHRSEQPQLAHLPYEVKPLPANPFVRMALLDDEDQLKEINSQLLGAYNFNNIMTAVCLGKYFKVPVGRIQSAIASYQAQNNRSQLIQGEKHTYLLDAYNANPSSMRLALDNLKQIQATRKVAILGDMLELGPYSAAEHRGIVDHALGHGFDDLILVGEEFEALRKDISAPVRYFPDYISLRQWLHQQDMAPTTFLIKGSRGIQLERILEKEELSD